MTTSSEARLEAWAATRYGLFTRSVAHALGISDRMIARRVDTGRWERLLPAVYRVIAVAPTFRQRALAGALWSSGHVSHVSAGRLWTLEGVSGADVHVTVGRNRGLRHESIIVHRRDDLIAADLDLAHGIPCTSALRTVLDMAELLDPLALEIAVEDALRRRLFSTGQLRWRAERYTGHGVLGSAAVRALLTQREPGLTGSGWEVRVARILSDAGFPEPVRQLAVPTLEGPRWVDLGYPGEPAVVFEYDSDRWHTGVRRRHADAARRNLLRLSGCIVVEITPALASHPARLVALVRSAGGLLGAMGDRPGA